MPNKYTDKNTDPKKSNTFSEYSLPILFLRNKFKSFLCELENFVTSSILKPKSVKPKTYMGTASILGKPRLNFSVTAVMYWPIKFAPNETNHPCGKAFIFK